MLLLPLKQKTFVKTEILFDDIEKHFFLINDMYFRYLKNILLTQSKNGLKAWLRSIKWLYFGYFLTAIYTVFLEILDYNLDQKKSKEIHIL